MAKKIGQKFPNGGHFPTCMHMATFVWFANVTTHESIPKKNLDLGFERLWPMLAYGKLLHIHPRMIRSTRSILSKSCALIMCCLIARNIKQLMLVIKWDDVVATS